MKNKIYCYSKREIINLIKNNKIDYKIPIISINNIISDGIIDWTVEPLPIIDNVLNLNFQDDSEDFSPDQAKKIIEFVLEHKRSDFLVHCIMGKSRSQAVCMFILDTWPDDYEYGRKIENPLKTPNYHVLCTLKRVWRLEFEENEFPSSNV